MRDKYNLNTLPAGAAGVDDHEIGVHDISYFGRSSIILCRFNIGLS